MTEGKINQFVVRTKHDLEDIIEPHRERDVTLVDEEVISCPHNEVYVRTGHSDDGNHMMIISCTSCGKTNHYEIPDDLLSESLRGDDSNMGGLKRIK